MSDDATIDSGLTDGLQSIVEDRFGNLDSEQALTAYAIISFVLTAFGHYGYTNNFSDMHEFWMYFYREWFSYHRTYYLPVGMAWLMIQFFPDSDFLDSVLFVVTGLSILGPFMGYW